MDKYSCLVIGASSAIAKAIIEKLLNDDANVIAISRSDSAPQDLKQYDTLQWHHCDYDEESIREWALANKAMVATLDKVFILNGILHSDTIFPEKRLKDLDPQAFLKSMTVNALTPLLWLKHLHQHFSKSRPLQIVVFSARVGSITDNRLGGWYSYRASKSALNMLLKSYSVELSRSHTHASIIVFHPGTTDSELSKPFQKNVPEGKLFEPDFVANCLMELLGEEHESSAPQRPTIQYRDWSKQAIPW